MKLTDSFIGRVILSLLIGQFVLFTAQAESSKGGDSNCHQAASAVRSTTGGKVLGVRGGKRGGSCSVRVLLPDGRVRTLRVDAQTGRVSD